MTMQRNRGETALKILDALAKTALAMPAIIVGILEAGYGASAGKMRYSIQKQMTDVNDGRVAREERRRRYQRYSMMLRYMRENGLISQRRFGDSIKLYLTPKGREKRSQLRAEAKTRIPVSGYEACPGKKIIIVAYDIPEKLSRYRDWLRTVLKRLGFKKLQQSVWVGKVLIPDQLLDDLMKYKLEEYVEIIAVSSSGMMREIF